MPQTPHESGPRRHLAPNGVWPEGPFATNPLPPGVEYARILSLRLKEALDAHGGSIRQFADETGITRNVITRVLNGQALATLATLEELEAALDVDLLPSTRLNPREP